MYIFHCGKRRIRILAFTFAFRCALVVGTIVASLIGITLHPNHASAQASKIYWTDFGVTKVQRANVDGSNVEDLVISASIQPFEIDVDGNAGKMYWTETLASKIQKANLDGSTIEDLVTGLDTPRGIAVDATNGKLYWTDWGTKKIQRANLDGTSVEDLVTGLDTPRGIVLDPVNSKMYWTDSGTQKIQRANMDGTVVEDLITTGLNTSVGIALDVSAGKFYWTDLVNSTVQRANLDGSNVETIISFGLMNPSYIAVDVLLGKIFWTDFGTAWVQRSNLDGSTIENVVTAGLSIPTGIALGPSAPLPVELSSFRAIPDGYRIDLQWTTESEANSAGFDVEVSSPAQGWTSVAYVAGAGSSSEARTYRHSYLAPDIGVYTFRLRQVDIDGSFEYSDEVEVEVTLSASASLGSVYPNPILQKGSVSVHVARGQVVRVSLFDIRGREIDVLYHGPIGGDNLMSLPIDVSGFAAGTYFIRARGESFQLSRKLVLVK